MSYSPQPGTIPARVMRYLREQAGRGRTWVPGAELADHVSQTQISPYIQVPITHGAIVRRPAPNNLRLSEYSLGNGIPLPVPPDLHPDEPLHPTPQVPQGATSRWPAIPARPSSETTTKRRAMPRTMSRIDPQKLSIANDPMPGHRATPNKYAELFSRLKPGQCIVCEGMQAGKIACALRKYVAEAGKSNIVRSTGRYDDGKGRVWLLAAPAARAARAA